MEVLPLKTLVIRSMITRESTAEERWVRGTRLPRELGEIFRDKDYTGCWIVRNRLLDLLSLVDDKYRLSGAVVALRIGWSKGVDWLLEGHYQDFIPISRRKKGKNPEDVGQRMTLKEGVTITKVIQEMARLGEQERLETYLSSNHVDVNTYILRGCARGGRTWAFQEYFSILPPLEQERIMSTDGSRMVEKAISSGCQEMVDYLVPLVPETNRNYRRWIEKALSTGNTPMLQWTLQVSRHLRAQMALNGSSLTKAIFRGYVDTVDTFLNYVQDHHPNLLSLWYARTLRDAILARRDNLIQHWWHRDHITHNIICTLVLQEQLQWLPLALSDHHKIPIPKFSNDEEKEKWLLPLLESTTSAYIRQRAEKLLGIEKSEEEKMENRE